MSKLVGICNLTPDSFSGDGILSTEDAVQRIAALLHEGAEVVDIGAESTRPGATPLTPSEEWARLSAVLSAARKTFPSAVFSVDTRHADTARKALAEGADWINDVSGFTHLDMIDAVKNQPCKLVLMHSRSIPASPSDVLEMHCDPVEEIMTFFKKQLALLHQAGINKARVILDPGIGFGKSAAHSFTLLRRVDELKTLGIPLLIGHSRKSFLAAFSPKPASARDEETLAVSCFLALKNVEYLRVHNVARHTQMLSVLASLA